MNFKIFTWIPAHILSIVLPSLLYVSQMTDIRLKYHKFNFCFTSNSITVEIFSQTYLSTNLNFQIKSVWNWIQLRVSHIGNFECSTCGMKTVPFLYWTHNLFLDSEQVDQQLFNVLYHWVFIYQTFLVVLFHYDSFTLWVK